MWSQTWGNIYDITTPYPGKTAPDATPYMVEKVNDCCDMTQT